MRVFSSLDELRDSVGEQIGPGEWFVLTQDRVNQFADATEDHQWIHVDVPRAVKSPFGGTIAHGYLTLSLVPMLANGLFKIDIDVTKLNYGVNKVRFPAPVPVGSSIRATATIASVEALGSGTQLTTKYVIEIEDGDKPACVAETVVLFLP